MRAFIRDYEIYLFDEFLSNVSSELKEKIVEFIFHELKGKTIIIRNFHKYVSIIQPINSDMVRIVCVVVMTYRVDCCRPNLLLFMENLSRSMINQSHFDLCGQNGEVAV